MRIWRKRNGYTMFEDLVPHPRSRVRELYRPLLQATNLGSPYVYRLETVYLLGGACLKPPVDKPLRLPPPRGPMYESARC